MNMSYDFGYKGRDFEISDEERARLMLEKTISKKDLERRLNDIYEICMANLKKYDNSVQQ